MPPSCDNVMESAQTDAYVIQETNMFDAKMQKIRIPFESQLFFLSG